MPYLLVFSVITLLLVIFCTDAEKPWLNRFYEALGIYQSILGLLVLFCIALLMLISLLCTVVFNLIVHRKAWP
jgi:hypothetical protein